MRSVRRAVLLVCLLETNGTQASVSAPAPESASPLEEVVVYGRAQTQIGSAISASEGLVGYDDIRLPPLLRVGELAEAVPGMVSTQHSGTGKANQYFLRGFNLDHGTDFSAHLDGVPINMRTHGHGQGYLDLNFLIPELVATTRYRKGTYHALAGDFSSAGSVEFSYYDRLPESLAQIEVGQDHYGRALLAASFEAGSGTFTGAIDSTRYDGPWALEEDLSQHKFHLGYTTQLGDASLQIALNGYDSEWDATDQIPRRAVLTGLIDALGFIDPDLGGATERYGLQVAVEAGRWRFGGYLVDYDFTLYSNFTYFLENPVRGDEFEQRDERSMLGFWVKHEQSMQWLGRPLVLRMGGELRVDDIDEVGLYGTSGRVRQSTVRSDSVTERSLGTYIESELNLNDRLRMVAGLRADLYDWEVHALRSENSGSGDDHLFSPKLALAYRLLPSLEAYASWGRGFHSNDVRGATIRIDPVTGDPAEPVDALVESEGAELGLRLEQGDRFNVTLAGFWLTLDSELVYVGDAGATEPNDATRRLGLEAVAFWQANAWLALNAAYTYTDAQFKADQGGGREIPGAVRENLVVGLTAAGASGWHASARVRYLGKAPLLEDDSVRSKASWLVNVGAGYRAGPLEIRVDVFNALDSSDDDIAYFYESRLPGEIVGEEDLHFHPLEPRTLRATLSYHWGG